MHLDVPTLMTMESFVAACAGIVLLVAWSQNRQASALALWGFANIVAAGGIFCMMLAMASHRPLASAFGGSMLVLAPGLMWMSARALDAKPTPLVFALLGTLIVGLANDIPGVRNVTGSFGLAVGSAYLFAAAFALWRSRNERLTARWPMIIFTTVHAAVLMIGAHSTLLGPTSQYEVPSLMTLFGVIHFESIVFALGSAVFILALIRERSEAASKVAAQVDPLTGIANRAAFFESAERVLERCRRADAPVSVLMFDLDRFKVVNDTHGHAVGDAVIRKFCEVGAKALRPNDVFGRLGGEEFAVVLPGSSIEAAYVRADRIRSSFAESCSSLGGRRVNATVSCGVSMSATGEEPLSALLEFSDIALYRAKSEGRNRVRRADQPRPQNQASPVLRVA